MVDWRAIDTAPRDGRHLLLYARDLGMSAHYRVTIGFFYLNDVGCEIINGEKDEGWRSIESENSIGDTSSAIILIPTHWQLLPDAPEAPANA